MGVTLVSDVQEQVQEFWAPTFMPQFIEGSVLPSLVNKDYEGIIKQKGDTVYVSTINTPTAQRKQVGAGHETFQTTKLETQRVSLVANQVISAAYEFDSLVELQSQIGDQDSKIRQGLLKALEIEVNNYLYSLVAPSTSAPDHSKNGVTNFNASELVALRKLAGQAHWPKMDDWWCLVDPSYHADLLSAQTLVSKDYVDGELPTVGGMIPNKRFGFNILEDDSAGMAQVSPTANTEDLGLAFHPDFMLAAMQKEPEFKVADLTANKQLGYILVVVLVMGATLSNDGDVKHAVVYNT